MPRSPPQKKRGSLLPKLMKEIEDEHLVKAGFRSKAARTTEVAIFTAQLVHCTQQILPFYGYICLQ